MSALVAFVAGALVLSSIVVFGASSFLGTERRERDRERTGPRRRRR